MTSSLADQAAEFANDLTQTTRAVVGDGCPPFAAVALTGADGFRVRQEPADGIVLSDADGPVLRLDVDYKCTYDGYRQYMAIEESQIRVFVEPEGKEPLFRYEFVRSATPSIPSAHIQFHGQHRELEQAMQDCGESTARAKARKRGQKPVRLSALHFPVGGPRFRPALEDVLEMLIEEFGIVPATGTVGAARAELAAARERWRRTQVATVVRDCPPAAAAALRELGYDVIPPDTEPSEKPDKLRAF